MPNMTKDQANLIKEVNALPEFFHKGRLCVEIGGKILTKESVIKTILLIG